MKNPALTICSLDHLIFRVTASSGYTHILSLLDANYRLAPIIWLSKENHLILHLDDLERNPVGIKEYILPNQGSVDRIIQFGRRVQETQRISNAPQSLLVHCHAGISRSTAAGYIILCDWLGENNERKAAKAIQRIQPQASPNPLMVALGDTLLKRGGKMIACLDVF